MCSAPNDTEHINERMECLNFTIEEVFSDNDTIDIVSTISIDSGASENEERPKNIEKVR